MAIFSRLKVEALFPWPWWCKKKHWWHSTARAGDWLVMDGIFSFSGLRLMAFSSRYKYNTVSGRKLNERRTAPDSQCYEGEWAEGSLCGANAVQCRMVRFAMW